MGSDTKRAVLTTIAEQCKGADSSQRDSGESQQGAAAPVLGEDEPVPHASSITAPADPGDKKESRQPLRPLTSVSWPPEPDESVFTDPLRKEDPKPLRREELLRIGACCSAFVSRRLVADPSATSPQLRRLLSGTQLPRILRIIDSLPTPNARSATLSRCLEIDDQSLAKPGSDSFLNGRNSPPPLGDLLEKLAQQDDPSSAGLRAGPEQSGWWLGREGTKEGRVWIGETERQLMRMWAGAVCTSIDGKEGDEVVLGQGGLGWEV